MKFILLASLLAGSSAIFPRNGGRPGRDGQRRTTDLARRGRRGSSSSSSSDEEGCDVRQVLFFAETTINEPYKILSFDKNTFPQPFDTEIINSPVFDYEAFMKDGSKIVTGYRAEVVTYLPFADFAPFADCLGQAAWTFYDPVSGELTGQVSFSYTCFGAEDMVPITGGIGDFSCAEGFLAPVILDVQEFFEEGTGFAVWKIVNCGKCDKN